MLQIKKVHSPPFQKAKLERPQASRIAIIKKNKKKQNE